MDTKTARYLNIVAGAWLSLSALLWWHSGLQWANTLIMGGIIIVVAAGAAEMPNLRYLNTLAGVWLILSALYLRPFSAGTRWNNLVVGVVVMVLSLVGRPTRRATQVRPI